jgi:hypothetical protein
MDISGRYDLQYQYFMIKAITEGKQHVSCRNITMYVKFMRIKYLYVLLDQIIEQQQFMQFFI